MAALQPLTSSRLDVYHHCNYSWTDHLSLRVSQAVTPFFYLPPIWAGEWVSSSITNLLVRYVLLPSLTLFPSSPATISQAQTLSVESFPCHGKIIPNASVKTADGVTLRGWEFHHESQASTPPADQKWVIRLAPNGIAFSAPETIKGFTCSTFNHLIYHRKIPLNVMQINYRGVQTSDPVTPKSASDLYRDGSAMVASLLERGVKPENILIHGWSLGGGVGAAVTAKYHKAGKMVRFISDRSFTSIVSVAINEVIPAIIRGIGSLLYSILMPGDADTTLCSKIRCFAFDMVAVPLLLVITSLALSILILLSPYLIYKGAMLNISASAVIHSIDPNHMRVIYHVKDEVIPHPSSSLAAYVQRNHPRIPLIEIARDFSPPEESGAHNHCKQLHEDEEALAGLATAVCELLGIDSSKRTEDGDPTPV